MKISSLNFHFTSAPIFTAREYGGHRWIEVVDADGEHDRFCLFVDDPRSFGDLSRIAAAMTAAWSDEHGSASGEA